MPKTKTITIEVTAEDIAAGVRRDCECCPVARALSRATGRACGIDDEGIYIAPYFDQTIAAPDAVRLFTRTFDSLGRAAVEPFAFELEVR